MAELEPRCESCGREDPVRKRSLEVAGRSTMVVPDTFRSPAWCPDCRMAANKLIELFKAGKLTVAA
jgi:hypothetical protein